MKLITIREVANGFMLTVGEPVGAEPTRMYVFNDFGQVTDFLSKNLNKQDSRYVNEGAEVKA